MSAIRPISSDAPISVEDADNYFVIIAELGDDDSYDIRIRSFIQNGREFIPLFSDDAHFELETAGSGFEEMGVFIRRDLLSNILTGDELLILNPGSSHPIHLKKDDL